MIYIQSYVCTYVHGDFAAEIPEILCRVWRLFDGVFSPVREGGLIKGWSHYKVISLKGGLMV